MNHFKLRKLPVAVCLAATLVLAGCHKKAVAPPPPAPPPPPAAAPTASINVNPSDINQGQSATLRWSTTNATSASIAGIGTVGLDGSQSVSPYSSTTYTLTARGAGGSVLEATERSWNASRRLRVNPPLRLHLRAPATSAALLP